MIKLFIAAASITGSQLHFPLYHQMDKAVPSQGRSAMAMLKSASRAAETGVCDTKLAALPIDALPTRTIWCRSLNATSQVASPFGCSLSKGLAFSSG